MTKTTNNGMSAGQDALQQDETDENDTAREEPEPDHCLRGTAGAGREQTLSSQKQPPRKIRQAVQHAGCAGPEGNVQENSRGGVSA